MSSKTSTKAPNKQAADSESLLVESAGILGGISWSVIMLIIGLAAVVIGIFAIPVLLLTPPAITGIAVETAAKLTDEEPHAPAATDAPAEKSNDASDTAKNGTEPNYRGSSEQPAAFPKNHQTD